MPMSVETSTNGLEGERRTVAFVGKKTFHGKTAYIYRVEGGGLDRYKKPWDDEEEEPWDDEEDEEGQVQLDEEGFIIPEGERLRFVYLAAPAPIDALLAPHLNRDDRDDHWTLVG